MHRSARVFLALRRGWCSLEKRLTLGLLLIVICALALQVMSHQQARRLSERGDALQIAARNAEAAEHLLGAVKDFQLRVHRAGSSTKGSPGSADEVIDAAVRIGIQANALRLAGVDYHRHQGDPAMFSEVPLELVLMVQNEQAIDDPARGARIDRRAEALAETTHSVEASLRAEQAQAFARLERATNAWRWTVGVAGALTTMLAILLLLNLLFQILPAMRRMNRNIRSLARGDLDTEVRNEDLLELQALSQPLEIFRRNAAAVRSLAHTDQATGLPNRRAFLEQAGRKLAELRDGEPARLVFLLIDIDRFKHINDDYGHAVGDQLVKQAGNRMAAELGECSVVARVGGDEFAIFTALTGNEAAASIGSHLVSALRAPFDLGGFQVAVTVSCGLVEVTSCEATNVEVLLHQADLALYASKDAGRNRCTLYTTELGTEREYDRVLERDLNRAFEARQLRMVYQPIHSVSGSKREVEALVRWRHPRFGDVSPTRFIPAAERSGQMVKLGCFVIERALSDLAKWPEVSMSINLSPLQLQQDGFAAYLLKICQERQILPERVTLEVTETISIERNTRALLTLDILRSMRFRVALDDFGTGYSSLSLMKTFRFDRLKLDRSLVVDLQDNVVSRAVLNAAVTMAAEIGLEVVAEGISEQGLVDPVTSAGCTHLQGFYYSLPIEAEEIEGYFATAPKVTTVKAA